MGIFSMYRNELRTSFRSMARSPGFVVASVAVLTLGVGTNLILAALLYAVLGRPLAFPDSDRLVTVRSTRTNSDGRFAIALQQAAVVPQQVPSVMVPGLYTSRAFASSTMFTLMGGPEPVEISTIPVNSEYLRALSVHPVVGRFFERDMDRAGAQDSQGIISAETWRVYFGGDASIVDKAYPFEHDGRREMIRIIGVAPDCAFFNTAGGEAEMFIPLPWLSPEQHGVLFSYTPVFRLRPDVPLAQASAEINRAFRRFMPESGFRYSVVPLRNMLAPLDHGTLFLVFGGSCLLLTLTIVNLASMFVVRQMRFSGDTAVRLALGAPRSRILVSLVIDALMVSTAATVAALVLFVASRPALLKFLPALRNLSPDALAMDWALVGYCLIICTLISGAVAIASFLITRRHGLMSALHLNGKGQPGARRRGQMVLVTVQIAVVSILLVAAALLGRSFVSAAREKPGFDARGILAFHASFSAHAITSPLALSETTSVGYQLSSVLANMPLFKQIAFSDGPMFGEVRSCPMSGRMRNPRASDPMGSLRLVSGTYLETLGAHLQSGRFFTDDEVQDRAPVVVINRSAAKLYYPSEDPLGRVLNLSFGDLHLTVVGIVDDIREVGLDRRPEPTVYVPHIPITTGNLDFIVRTGEPPMVAFNAIQQRIRSLNRPVFLHHPQSLVELSESTIRVRLIAVSLIGCFALLGLLVSCVGLYGAVAAQVEQQRREIAICMALGATRQEIIERSLSESVRVIVIGVSAGLVGVYILVPLLQHYLYHVKAWDLGSYLLAVFLLGIAVVLALLPPALRATRVDPIQVLRAE